jgi:flagellar biosynthesis protein FlhF
MQLRTFLAKDMKAALADVRAQMGPEAVIVASEKAKGGGVMVRAAIDHPDTPVFGEDIEDDEEAVTEFDANFHKTLIRRLREKPVEKRGRKRFDRGELLSSFARHRLPDALAHALAEESAKTGLSDMTLALAKAVDARMNSMPLDFTAAKVFLLIGPNGAGKTAVAAKLAAHAKLAGRAVLLIAGDVTGAGAVARLKEFAEHLDARVEAADSAFTLANLVGDAVEDGVLAIIDTAGFDPRQPKIAAVFAALAKIENVDTLGVISALTDAEESAEIAIALARIGAKRLIVTACDLTRRAGALAAAALTSGIGLAHITRSPFVAGSLESLTPLALSRLLAENEQESAQ